MTMPVERTRNLLQAGAFLKELEADTLLPEAIRREAHRLLRHYPTVHEIRLMATVESKFAGAFLLTPEIDKNWFSDYRFGPHTG